MNKEKLGSFLMAAREAAGYTRAELSEKSGISSSYIFDVEKARGRNPSQDTLFKLADGLGLDPREVFTAAEVEFPLKEKPEKFIALPFDYPHEAQRQVESFAKFLRYQEEFEQFLRVYENRPGGDQPERQPSWEEFMAEVRGSGQANNRLDRASGDNGGGRQ